MKLILKRMLFKETYTVGVLYINGIAFCNTLEDKDRGLDTAMPLEEIKKIKVYGETAIPYGNYKITLDIVSPKFSKKIFYKNICNGKVPRLLNVPGFEGILIHVANGPEREHLLSGCIGIGDFEENQLVHGKETFRDLYSRLLQDKDNITLSIIN